MSSGTDAEIAVVLREGEAACVSACDPPSAAASRSSCAAPGTVTRWLACLPPPPASWMRRSAGLRLPSKTTMGAVLEALQDPRPHGALARAAPGADRPGHRRQGRQAAEGRPNGGRARRVHLPLGGQGVQAYGRRDHRDARRGSGPGPFRLDHPRAARRDRRHLALQLPASTWSPTRWRRPWPAATWWCSSRPRPRRSPPSTSRACSAGGAARRRFQVVVGSGRVIGTPMVKDPRVAMVTFTGSPAVGKQIAADAGMKRVTLELGSNSATIVDEDADIDLAVQRIVLGGFTSRPGVHLGTAGHRPSQGVRGGARQADRRGRAPQVRRPHGSRDRRERPHLAPKRPSASAPGCRKRSIRAPDWPSEGRTAAACSGRPYWWT